MEDEIIILALIKSEEFPSEVGEVMQDTGAFPCQKVHSTNWTEEIIDLTSDRALRIFILCDFSKVTVIH